MLDTSQPSSGKSTVGLDVGLTLGEFDGPSSVVGDDVWGVVGVAVVGDTDGDAVARFSREVPAWQTPKGTELHAVKSGKYCGGGQLPSELHVTDFSQSLSPPQMQSVDELVTSLNVQKLEPISWPSVR